MSTHDALHRTTTPPHVRRREPLPLATSPRLAALQGLAALEGAGPEVLEQFWCELAVEGAPLIEDAPSAPGGASDTQLVSFVWREDEESERQILLFASKLTDSTSPADTLLRPIPGTDIRALTLELPKAWVGSYLFVPLDDGVFTAGAPIDRRSLQAAMRAGVVDPLAKHTILMKPQGPRMAVGNAAGAPERPAFGDEGAPLPVLDVPAATLTDPAPVVRLWRPRTGTPSRLLVLLDGEVWAARLPALLREAPWARDLAVAFVESGGPDARARDYAGNDAFLAFLARDLRAAVADALALKEGAPALTTIIAGQSLGGLCAITAALSHPTAFAGAISQSGSFWWPSGSPAERDRNATARLAADPATAMPDWIELQWGDLEWDMRGDQRHMRDVLVARGATMHVVEVPGGHDVAWWERLLPPAIERALAATDGASGGARGRDATA